MHSYDQPTLFILGSSHKEAKLEDRETFSLDKNEIHTLSSDIAKQNFIDECLVLNTCNRLEIYGVSKNESPKIIKESITSHPILRESLFSKYCFFKKQSEAIEHSFELASGLESQMIGETEILGQMKEAFLKAKDSNFSNYQLNRLFEKSFQAAKIVRTQTGITKGHVSIGNVAVHLASRIFGAIEESRILLIGSGDVSEKTAQALRTKGVNDITVSSRSKEKTDELSEKFSASSIHFQNFKSKMQHYDIIISSTSSPEPIIDLKSVEYAIKKGPQRPLFMIDLAMPRDMENEISNINNVYLYNLDSLAKIANENMEQRKLEISKAKQIIKSQAWSFWLNLQRRKFFKQNQ